MNERELLVDCLQRLNALDVNYMITGSMASNFWGIPRTTHDLDFVLRFRPDQIDQIALAFEDDFFIQRRSIQAAFDPPHQFNAIDSRSALKVDFWLLKAAPFEQQMFARRQRETLFEHTAWIATAEDVILHKLYWHKLNPSDRQLGDAAGVVAVQGDGLDRAYLEEWAGKIGVSGVLADLLQGRIKPKNT